MADEADRTSTTVDLTGTYAVTAGVEIIPRGDDDLQIGLDGPQALVLRRAPAATAAVVRDLDGRRPLHVVLDAHGVDHALWSRVLAGLLAAGLVQPVPSPGEGRVHREPAGRPQDSHTMPDRIALGERFGARAAERAMAARSEATVVVHGAGRVAGWISGLLATSGVGHVHQRADRSLRPTDLVIRDGPPVGAGRADATALAARIRSFAPQVRTHRPVDPMRTTAQVLAGDGPADPGLAAQLTREYVPHLQAWAGPGRAVVGPLVLPGRTSCLNCAQLYRTAIDRHWPAVAAALRVRRVPPPTMTAVAVASLAVAEVLEFIDGVGRPATVNGTFDWPGWGTPRRRSWQPHPECGCRQPASPPPSGP